MAQTQVLKANILQKRSPKGIRGFRWQKRMFRLYHDKIVYSAIETDTALGEIPLICITKITVRPNNKKLRFNLVMGTFRTFELQAGTEQMVDEWVEILARILRTFDNNERQRMLKLQRDKFWKLDSNDNEKSPSVNAVQAPKNQNGSPFDLNNNNNNNDTNNDNNNNNGNNSRKTSQSHSNNTIGSPKESNGKFTRMLSNVMKKSKSNLNHTDSSNNNNSNNNNNNNNIQNGSNNINNNVNNNNNAEIPFDSSNDDEKYDIVNINHINGNGTNINNKNSIVYNNTPQRHKSTKLDPKYTGTTNNSSTYDGVSHDIIEPSYTHTQTHDMNNNKNSRKLRNAPSMDISQFSQNGIKIVNSTNNNNNNNLNSPFITYGSAPKNNENNNNNDMNDKRMSGRSHRNDGGNRRARGGRLSIMEHVLPSDVNDYKIEEEFVTMAQNSTKKRKHTKSTKINKRNSNNHKSIASAKEASVQHEIDETVPPFGKVAIVSTEVSDAPYLLQVINKSHHDYPLALSAMNTMAKIINPYIITQLRRGETMNMSWASYNCPSNGCLTNCLHLFRNVSVTSVRILVAEVICALECLHRLKLNFPNLSPETIYISHKAHIILTDFGFGLPSFDSRTNKPVIYRTGPLCYAPPEFLLYGKDDMLSDWWRLGVLTYHLIMGRPPFMGKRELVCQSICQGQLTDEFLFSDYGRNNSGNYNENSNSHTPQVHSHSSRNHNSRGGGQYDDDDDDDFENKLDPTVKDFILRLLTRDRETRLGSKDINDILNHKFFDDINSDRYEFDWNDIRHRDHLPAPILRHLATREVDSDSEKKLDRELDHPMYDFNGFNDLNINDTNSPMLNSVNSHNNANTLSPGNSMIVNHTSVNGVANIYHTNQSPSMTPSQTVNTRVTNKSNRNKNSMTITPQSSEHNQPPQHQQHQQHHISQSPNANTITPMTNSGQAHGNIIGGGSNVGDDNDLNGVISMDEKYDQPLSPIRESGLSSDGTVPFTHMASNSGGDVAVIINKKDSLPSHLNTVLQANVGNNDYMHLSEPMIPSNQKHLVSAVIDAAQRKQESMEFFANDAAAAAAATAIAANNDKQETYSEADSTDDLFGNYVPPSGIGGRNGNPEKAIEDDYGLGAAPTNEENQMLQNNESKDDSPVSNEYNNNNNNNDRDDENNNENDNFGDGNNDMMRDRGVSEVSDQIAAAAHLRQPIPKTKTLDDISKENNSKDNSNNKKRISLFGSKNNNNNNNALINDANDDANSMIDDGFMDDNDNNNNEDIFASQNNDEFSMSRANTFANNNNGKKKKKGGFLGKNKEKSKFGLDKILKSKADALFADKVRKAVSKKKRRFIDKNYDFNLDLTYITKRIIAMGFPAEGQESMYRNPMNEVQRFFRTYHNNHFKVYNLCNEKDRQYHASKFTNCGGEVAKYGFKDHNAPELELILEFCKDVHEFLGRDRENVVAIHCKAGKGRTGVMICAYLVYAKICKSAQDALFKYGEARTFNSKGVTIPSQRRYVLYFANYVLNPIMTPIPDRFSFYKIVILKRIRMNTIPNFDVGGGCDPYFLILNTKGEILYDYSQHNPVKPQRSKKANDKNSLNKKRKSKKLTKTRSLLSSKKGNKNRENSKDNTKDDNDDLDSYYDEQRSISKNGSSAHNSAAAGGGDNKDKGPPPMSLAEFFANEQEQEFVKFGDLDIILRGSFKIVFYDKDVLSSDDIMCWTWCHSAICANEKYIRLERDEIDGAVKDKKMKHFDDSFSLEFWFDTPLDSTNKKDQHYHTDTQPRLFDEIDINLLNNGAKSPVKINMNGVNGNILAGAGAGGGTIDSDENEFENELMKLDAKYSNKNKQQQDDYNELMNSIEQINRDIGINSGNEHQHNYNGFNNSDGNIVSPTDPSLLPEMPDETPKSSTNKQYQFNINAKLNKALPSVPNNTMNNSTNSPSVGNRYDARYQQYKPLPNSPQRSQNTNNNNNDNVNDNNNNNNNNDNNEDIEDSENAARKTTFV